VAVGSFDDDVIVDGHASMGGHQWPASDDERRTPNAPPEVASDHKPSFSSRKSLAESRGLALEVARE